MTDQQTPAQSLAAAIITTSGETLGVQSVDLTEVGVLYVYYDGSTNLLPWHMVARIAFFDEPVDVPTRNEGRE